MPHIYLLCVCVCHSPFVWYIFVCMCVRVCIESFCSNSICTFLSLFAFAMPSGNSASRSFSLSLSLCVRPALRLQIGNLFSILFCCYFFATFLNDRILSRVSGLFTLGVGDVGRNQKHWFQCAVNGIEYQTNEVECENEWKHIEYACCELNALTAISHFSLSLSPSLPFNIYHAVCTV